MHQTIYPPRVKKGHLSSKVFTSSNCVQSQGQAACSKTCFSILAWYGKITTGEVNSPLYDTPGRGMQTHSKNNTCSGGTAIMETLVLFTWSFLTGSQKSHTASFLNCVLIVFLQDYLSPKKPVITK